MAGQIDNRNQGRKGSMKRELLKIENGYSFWKFTQGRLVEWNITPMHHDAPGGGYADKEYIEGVKHQKFDKRERKNATVIVI